MDDILSYVKRRNKALLALNKEELISIANESGAKIPEDERIFWAGVHYARLGVTTFSEEVKEISKGWLRNHGFRYQLYSNTPAQTKEYLTDIKTKRGNMEKITLEQGIKMIIALQAMGGITETEEQATAG